ncbi:MAG TPA: response regulator transcription factor [Polyangiaceae bacterium]|nr:response regulator transcription factor [Polyangiaceae bacterium]
MTKLQIFLADDHPIVRSGLRGLLEAQPDMAVVGEAVDGASAVRAVTDLQSDRKVDVVVMDVSMPGLGGAEATEWLHRECPAVKIVALTAHEERGYLQHLLAAGASGYVLKRAAADDLVRAIRAVAAGERYVDPSFEGPPAGEPSAPRAMAPGAELSEREADVLRRVAQGHTVKQIAAALDIGVRTVETYKVRGMEKLGLKTRAELVRYAVQRGWLSGG